MSSSTSTYVTPRVTGSTWRTSCPRSKQRAVRYLARGGPHTVYEGDWSPYRLVLLEFPSREAFEGFYHSPAYQDLHALRDEVSYARMVGVEGLPLA